MRLLFLSIVIHLLLPQIAKAQSDLRVFTELDNVKQGYRIMADKAKIGTYTCVVTFRQLVGYTCSEGTDNFTATVLNTGPQQIATITRIPNATSYSSDYKYAYYRGLSISKMDSLYPYLLPRTAGNDIETSGVTYIGDILGKSSSDFYSIGFKYAFNDTICATRGGLVYEAYDKAEPRKENQFYSVLTRNNIAIEQNDGTLARYSILSHIRLLIKEGDKVIPGQPLAVFDKTDKDYTMLFSVSYLNLNKQNTTGSHYMSVRPRFVISTDIVGLAKPYIVYPSVIHPFEVVTKEMSKKEIKQLGLKKSN